MSEYQNERELGWDDSIENDGGDYTIVEEGDYAFEVIRMERKRHTPQAGGKLPACPKAELTIRLYYPNGQAAADITHNLFLHSRTEGLLCEFFRGIGQRKHGERLRPDWNRVIAARGRCHVVVRTFTKNDGTKGQSNDIKKFYDQDESESQTPASDKLHDGTPF